MEVAPCCVLEVSVGGTYCYREVGYLELLFSFSSRESMPHLVSKSYYSDFLGPVVTTLKLRLPCPYLHLSLSQGKLEHIHGELGKRRVGLEDKCNGERLVPEPGSQPSSPIQSLAFKPGCGSTCLHYPGITPLLALLRE